MEMPALVPLLSSGTDVSGLAQHGRPQTEQAMNSAATAFESVFMSMLLKEMRQTSDGSSLLFGKDAGDVLGGLFDQFMGQHLAQSGSLGISAMLKKSWQTQANRQAHSALPAGRSASPAAPAAAVNQSHQVKRAYDANRRQT